MDFGEVENAAGGQLSSSSDLAKVMQMFLDPTINGSIVEPSEVKAWLRPAYVWPDELTETGAPWEIMKIRDAYGRQQRYYQKGVHNPMVPVPLPSLTLSLTSWRFGNFALEFRFQSRPRLRIDRSPQRVGPRSRIDYANICRRATTGFPRRPGEPSTSNVCRKLDRRRIQFHQCRSSEWNALGHDLDIEWHGHSADILWCTCTS